MITFLNFSELRPFVRSYLSSDQFSLVQLKGGLLNQNVIVRTSSSQLLLKVYRKEVSLSKLDEMHRIMSHCAQRGIPVQELFVTAPVAGYQVGLYPFIEGEHPARYGNSLVRLRDMGTVLGRIEQALSSFNSAANSPSAQELVKWNPDMFLKEIAGVRAALKAKPESVRREVNENLDYYERIVHGGEWSSKSFLDLPIRFIHGDYHVDNILFQGDCVVGVLDWEKVGKDWLGYELVRSLMFNCRLVSRDFHWPRVEAYVRAYRISYGEWTDLERQLAFDCGFRRALFSLWTVKEYVNGHRTIRGNMLRRVHLLETLANKRDEYTERLKRLLQ